MITLTREEAQQVLDALGKVFDHNDWQSYETTVDLLRARLSAPEPEPVAWGIANTRPTEKHPLMMVMTYKPEPSSLVVPLYTAPPQREWQGLTDEEIMSLLPGAVRLPPGWSETVRAIEAKLKEKNT